MMECKKLKLSIIIPFYNVEPYFEQCLVSLIDMNYSDQYEILLIDDCGNDNSIKIAEKFKLEHPDLIKIISHEKNEGLSVARNTGVSNVNAEYVMFVDSDDWLDLNSVGCLISYLSESFYDLIIYDYKCEWPDKHKKIIISDDISDITLVKNPSPEMLLKLPVTAWGKIFRYSIVKEFSFPKGVIFEDFATVPAVMAQCSTIKYIPRVYYHYRQRQGSIMDTQGLNFQSLHKCYDHLVKYVQQENAIYIEKILVDNLLSNTRRLYQSGDKKSASNLLNWGIKWLNIKFKGWGKNNRDNIYIGSKKFTYKIYILLFIMNFRFGREIFLKTLNFEKITLKDICFGFKE